MSIIFGVWEVVAAWWGIGVMLWGLVLFLPKVRITVLPVLESILLFLNGLLFLLFGFFLAFDFGSFLFFILIIPVLFIGGVFLYRLGRSKNYDKRFSVGDNIYVWGVWAIWSFGACLGFVVLPTIGADPIVSPPGHFYLVVVLLTLRMIWFLTKETRARHRYLLPLGGISSALVLTLWLLVVYADDTLQLQLINNCYQCDLSGFDLSNSDLSGAYLRGANLASANLTGARLDGADLRNANLAGANLTGVRLDGADLRGANLPGANLTGVRLDGVRWEGNGDSSHVSLEGANLTRASLVGAKLKRARLSNANFTGADLRRAVFHSARVRDANFTGADLRGADFQWARGRNANFTGADLRGGYISVLGFKNIILCATTMPDGTTNDSGCDIDRRLHNGLSLTAWHNQLYQSQPVRRTHLLRVSNKHIRDSVKHWCVRGIRNERSPYRPDGFRCTNFSTDRSLDGTRLLFCCFS